MAGITVGPVFPGSAEMWQCDPMSVGAIVSLSISVDEPCGEEMNLSMIGGGEMGERWRVAGEICVDPRAAGDEEEEEEVEFDDDGEDEEFEEDDEFEDDDDVEEDDLDELDEDAEEEEEEEF